MSMEEPKRAFTFAMEQASASKDLEREALYEGMLEFVKAVDSQFQAMERRLLAIEHLIGRIASR